MTAGLSRYAKALGRIACIAIGLYLVWMAYTIATSDALFVASATQEGEAGYEPVVTWWSTLTRYIYAALMAFFGVTLAAIPFRRKRVAEPTPPA